MAHTFDTSAQIAAATSNPQAANYTCGSGATVLVVTLIYAYGTRTGAPTYNSVALTEADQVRNAASGPEACAEIWYMLGPPTGSSYSLSVPNPNGLLLEVCISSYSAPSGMTSLFHTATGSQSNSGANPTCTITTTMDLCTLVAVVASGADTWAPTGRAGTQLYDTDNDGWGGGHQYFMQDAAGGKAMNWTFATADDYGICVAAFSEIGIGVNVSKANIYAVLSPGIGVNISKAVIYAVLNSTTPLTANPVDRFTRWLPVQEG